MNWETLAGYGITPESLRIFLLIGLVHLGFGTLIWIIGLRHKNHSLLDSYWGFAFVIAGWMAWVMGDASTDRARLVLTLTTIWGARLGYHLFSRWARIHALGGDLRYQDIKDNMIGAQGYWWKSLFAVIWPMGIANTIAQINMVWLIITPDQPALGPLDVLFGAIMAGAILLETTADLQLDAFKANPANHGKVLRTGVWAWSRHPNYFADFCCYWCVFAISLAVPHLLWTVVAPLFMSYLLAGYTGKNWLDGHMRKRRPDYEDYIRCTSGFVPWPPKKR